MTVTEKTSPEYAKVLDFLSSRGEIKTGVLTAEGAQTYDDGTTVLDIAEAAEFGLGQPQRSWLRQWFDEHSTELEAVIEREFTKALENREDFEVAGERVALWLQAHIQRRIRNGIAPPNAPETIARKGSSTPLIDTGLFRSSVVSYWQGKRVQA